MQEEAIDYDEVFAPVARIEAIRIFLAFSSFMGFIVYQMDVKSTFLYSTIDKEVYVTQPLGFVDPKFPNKVYKVVKALYGLHQAPRAWYATLSTFLEKSRYRRGAIDKTLFIKQDKKDIMLVQVYTASTLIETQKPLVKDKEAADVDVYLYRYLKGQPKLGLWYFKVSSFDLKAYSDSDYAGANLDRKSTTRDKFCGFRINYRFNIINTKIYIDNESTICIVKNPVFHSKTKHIEIQHHFIRDAYEKKLIQVLKIYTDDNVADLLMKDFDVSRKKVIVTEDVIRQVLCFDNADGVECLPNEEIFTELARMGYEKPPPNAEDGVERIQLLNGPSKFVMYPWFLQVMINAQVDDLSSHTNQYTSPALTQKVFANMRRVGKGFSGVETPLFATMLVPPPAAEEVKDVEVPATQ
nr:copia protein [Tanacetum cinerariifolium]